MLWVVGAPARLFTVLADAWSAWPRSTSPSTDAERRERLTNFVDPFKDYHDAGWQPAHGLFALSSGGWFGQGIGASQQKWGDLPEAHTDFIFAVLGEELGLVGTLLVRRAVPRPSPTPRIRVALRTTDPFVRYMTFGIVVWLLGQMIINVGMVLALLPVIGIPLPLVSYGGSALLPSLVALGLLIGFARREPEAARALAQRRRARSAGLSAGGCPSAASRIWSTMRVLLAGGGTAGHTSPLLATADALRRLEPDVEITCLGTPRGLENRVVPEAGYPLELIPPVPLPRRPSADLFKVPGPAARRRQGDARGPRPGPPRRRRRLRRLRLDAGLPRRPPPQAAAGRPRAERAARPGQQGSAPGSPPGSRSSFPDTPLPQGRVRRPADPPDDLPARPGRACAPRPARSSGSTPTCPTLLVTGGSQGARRLNQSVSGAARALGDAGSRCCTSSARRARPSPEPTGARRTSSLDFVDRMDLAYAAADLMVCRAGASSVTEAAAVGLPAVFVPLPIGNGEQDAQRPPGRRRRRRPAGRRRRAHPEWVAATVPGLATDADRLAAMGAAASALIPRDADEQLARIVLDAAAGGAPVKVPVPDEILPADRLGRVHFVGIGGAGLSGIARIMARPRHPGQRQRRQRLPGPRRAARARRPCRPRARRRPRRRRRHRRRLDRRPRGQPRGRSRPSQRGLRMLPALGRAWPSVMDGRRVVAVAGTHGKTTTTSLLTVALQAAGADPTYAIGGDARRRPASTPHAGTGDLFVAEADESDGAFLVYAPYAAIVTNVEADHLDHWGTEEAYRAAFVEFVDTVDPDGFLVCCVDDAGAAACRAALAARRARGRVRRRRARHDLVFGRLVVHVHDGARAG